MGTEGVKIKRAKYIEAGLEVMVHVFIFGKYLSALHTHLQSMMSDVSVNVRLIEQVKPALLRSVREILQGKYIKRSG